MGHFDDLEALHRIGRTGHVWVHVLVKYDFISGKSEVVKSFSNVAKDSDIKGTKKEIKKDVSELLKKKMQKSMDSTEQKTSSLF